MTLPDTHKYTPVAVPLQGGANGTSVDEAVIALEERFVTTADSPSTDAQPYLEVVAPATLPEVGYHIQR